MITMELAGLNYFYKSCYVNLQWEDIYPHRFPQNRIQWIPSSVFDKCNLLFSLISGEGWVLQTYYSKFYIDLFASNINPMDYYELF